MKILVGLVILAIMISLGSALIAMLKGGDANSNRMFRSLQLRIILSVLLFVFLMFAGYMGWLEPNQVVLDRYQ